MILEIDIFCFIIHKMLQNKKLQKKKFKHIIFFRKPLVIISPDRIHHLDVHMFQTSSNQFSWPYINVTMVMSLLDIHDMYVHLALYT